nr:MAG TPA: hypothetical protein [Bacteriophage sp.]
MSGYLKPLLDEGFANTETKNQINGTLEKLKTYVRDQQQATIDKMESDPFGNNFDEELNKWVDKEKEIQNI